MTIKLAEERVIELRMQGMSLVGISKKLKQSLKKVTVFLQQKNLASVEALIKIKEENGETYKCYIEPKPHELIKYKGFEFTKDILRRYLQVVEKRNALHSLSMKLKSKEELLAESQYGQCQIFETPLYRSR